jgi:anti-sigma28 factor (negative regulator of flagellin synthesis)
MISQGDTDRRTPVGPSEIIPSYALQGKNGRLVTLRSAIERGHYNIEPERVAEKMMQNLIPALFHT